MLTIAGSAEKLLTPVQEWPSIKEGTLFVHRPVVVMGYRGMPADPAKIYVRVRELFP